jgi:hypothetical protein
MNGEALDRTSSPYKPSKRLALIQTGKRQDLTPAFRSLPHFSLPG